MPEPFPLVPPEIVPLFTRLPLPAKVTPIPPAPAITAKEGIAIATIATIAASVAIATIDCATIGQRSC
jgi:hypothetical protein